MSRAPGTIVGEVRLIGIAIELTSCPLAERGEIEAPCEHKGTPKQGRDGHLVVHRLILNLPEQRHIFTIRPASEVVRSLHAAPRQAPWASASLRQWVLPRQSGAADLVAARGCAAPFA